jgi:hypothetical protein
MGPTELKIQATLLHFRKKLATEIKMSGFFRKCIVGCIFYSVGLIITREYPCIQTILLQSQTLKPSTVW